MKQLQVTATFPRIPGDNLSEFKRLAGEALKLTADDPGVPQYDWYFNDDETKCVVRETYADSDAVLTHLGLLGDLLGTIIELGGGVQIEVFGSPSDSLLKVTESLQPTIYSVLPRQVTHERALGCLPVVRRRPTVVDLVTSGSGLVDRDAPSRAFGIAQTHPGQWAS